MEVGKWVGDDCGALDGYEDENGCGEGTDTGWRWLWDWLMTTIRDGREVGDIYESESFVELGRTLVKDGRMTGTGMR